MQVIQQSNGTKKFYIQQSFNDPESMHLFLEKNEDQALKLSDVVLIGTEQTNQNTYFVIDLLTNIFKEFPLCPFFKPWF